MHFWCHNIILVLYSILMFSSDWTRSGWNLLWCFLGYCAFSAQWLFAIKPIIHSTVPDPNFYQIYDIAKKWIMSISTASYIVLLNYRYRPNSGLETIYLIIYEQLLIIKVAIYKMLMSFVMIDIQLVFEELNDFVLFLCVLTS